MATPDVGLGPRLVQIRGEDPALVEWLRAPLAGALEERHNVYVVEVETVGRGAQVLVCIHGSRGRLPLLFQMDELEQGNVLRVVRDTVIRLGL